MGMCLPVIEERLRIAKRNLPAVEEYLDRRGKLVQATIMKESIARPVVQHFRHTDRHRQDWFCMLRVDEERIEHSAVLYWLHCPRGRRGSETLEAIQVRPQGRSLYFDTHFFGRWGLRTEQLRVKLTNMQGFFSRYPRLTMLDVETFKHGRRAMAAAIDHGLVHGAVLGRWLISCDTFIGLQHMHARDRELWERLRLCRTDQEGPSGEEQV